MPYCHQSNVHVSCGSANIEVTPTRLALLQRVGSLYWSYSEWYTAIETEVNTGVQVGAQA